VNFLTRNSQKLYNELIQQGSISKVEALRVGVIIEEMDIHDLNEGIATTQHNDIKTVYSNLFTGLPKSSRCFRIYSDEVLRLK